MKTFMRLASIALWALLVAACESAPALPLTQAPPTAAPAPTNPPTAAPPTTAPTAAALRAASHITKIVIDRVESPTFEGASFGSVGKYEKLVGRAFGEVDPNDPHNALIADIALAPRNAGGMVEYTSDVYILRPVERSLGNHKIFFEPSNRGNIYSFAQLNNATSGGNDPTTAADAGNGFLMRQGYTIVINGWDVTAARGGGRLTFMVPAAKNADGSSIVGPALEEFVIDNSTTITATLTYAAANRDKAQASLTMRALAMDPPVAVPSSDWEYINDTSIRLLPGGTPFQNGRLYELVYPAKDSLLAGLGFAATRDLASFLRYASQDDAGNPNPVAGNAKQIYTFCYSQPCRMLHDFVHLGFNADTQGRQVFDGVLNWTGGASGIFMNYRFAQPGRTQREHIARWYPEFQFPFANQVIYDPVTKQTDGRLARCQQSSTCPKIFEVNSENEYWSKAGSNLDTDSLGNDLGDLPNVRYYLMASLPHFADTGPGICQQPRNPLVANPTLRALLVAMDEWVSAGKEPPASRMPRRADGTLVPPLPQAGMGFPNIPGVTYNGALHSGDLLDFGPSFDKGILTVLPPKLVGSPYPVLVPKTDADGNDIAGVRQPEVAVPLATYTGWGLRTGPAAGDGCDHWGQKIDLPKTKADRLVAGDPRLSLEERYGSQQAYVDAVTRAARMLMTDRLLLAEDVGQYIQRAQAESLGFLPK